MADETSAYDRLFITRAIFFIALIMMCNIAAVTAIYSFWIQKPFHVVLTAERASFAKALSPQLHTTMRFNGDSLYDGLFVRSGVERFAYGQLKASEHDIAGQAVSDMRVFGSILDNLFDYMLLLCYRAGFFSVTLSYIFVLVVAVSIHGAIIRHRKRFGFGDTPLLMNVWARTTLAYCMPFSFMIWSLPVALNPILLIGSLSTCVIGIALFAFSLPKIA